MKCQTLSLLLLAALAACKDSYETPSAAPREVPKLAAPAAANPRPAGPGPAAAEKSPLAWKAPAGWTEIAPAQFRNPNFKIDAVPEAEAYVTLLPGAGGGTESNLNRWHSQFGLPPLSAEQIAALPKLTAMGRPAVLLDQTGKFGGMNGAEARENWRLVGAIIDLPAALVTVKMTGPAAGLEGELQRFKDFVQSLTMAAPEAAQPMTGVMPSTTTLPAGHPPIGASSGETAPLPGATAAAEAPLTWTLPADWSPGPEKKMRLASFQVKGIPEMDISLIMLAGAAGGKEANIAMWYGQVGQQPPAADAMAKLPTIKILGQDSPIVEASGSYSGPGRDQIANAALLGAICEMPDQALFVKMTGPADAVKTQHDAFIAFCLSLKKK